VSGEQYTRRRASALHECLWRQQRSSARARQRSVLIKRETRGARVRAMLRHATAFCCRGAAAVVALSLLLRC